MLLIGGLYGRIIGRALVDYYGIQEDKYWVAASLVLIMTHVTLLSHPPGLDGPRGLCAARIRLIFCR